MSSTKPYSIRYVFTPWQVSLLELISNNVSYHLSLIDDIITFPLASYETSLKWPFKFDREQADLLPQICNGSD